MRRVLLGLYAYVEFVLFAFLFMIPMGIAALVYRDTDPVMRMRGRWMRYFGRTVGAMMPLWRLSVEGDPPADINHRGYVVISNHESATDPFLITWFKWDMRYLAKQELFDTPIVGWLLKLSGDIPIKRGSRESVEKMMEECRVTLRGGVSVMLFPEGTRSDGGDLLPFKDGAFQLAIETQAPLLLVSIAGTRKCRPKGSIWFGDAEARARIVGVLPVQGLTMEDVPRLKEIARARIGEGARDLRAELGLVDVGAPVHA